MMGEIPDLSAIVKNVCFPLTTQVGKANQKIKYEHYAKTGQINDSLLTIVR